MTYRQLFELQKRNNNRMNKNILLTSIALALLLSNSTQAAKPNIIVIMADDMGYECLSANGSLDYKTPVIDGLAAKGVRFEHCYSQPLCTPSRVKIMTGMSNKRNYKQFGLLEKSQTTFAHILKDAGYRTCIAGKWQLGNGPKGYEHFGFEQALIWHSGRRTTRTQGEHKGKDNRYSNPQLELNGEHADYTNGEYSTDLFVDFISDFIEKHKEEPFFVYYPMVLTHCPFFQTPDSEDRNPKSMGSPSYKGDPEYFKDMVEYVDKSVGKINAKLDELGLRENTLIIFAGDNGTDKPIVTKTTFGDVAGAKGTMTDGGNRVPCVASWPNEIKKPFVSQDIIDFSDILPTICEAADAKIPKDLPVDGVSFLPQLKGKKGNPRESIYVWYGHHSLHIFARNQRYKLYSTGTFYDIAEDRLETSAIAEADMTEQLNAVRGILQAKIDSFEDVKNPFGNPQPKKKRAGKKIRQ
jgi:arylsulfatase A